MSKDKIEIDSEKGSVLSGIRSLFTSKYEFFLYILMFAFLFFSFQHGDLWHTVVSSFAYLNGHILDFYDYNATVPLIGGSEYMPSTFIAFAIWLIPARIFGITNDPSPRFSFIFMYAKLLPVILYCVTSMLVYKISIILGMSKEKSKLCAFSFFLMPIAVYSQFIFGQYDIFTTFLMIAGLYYYLQNKSKWIWCFAFALTFKYLALLIFLVLLLLKEKRILHVIKNLIILTIPALIEIIIYLPSPTFRKFVTGNTAFPFAMRLQFTIQNGFAIMAPVFLLCITLGWAYFTDPADDHEFRGYIFFFVNLILFTMFGLSFFHPQWLLMGAPFWTISTFFKRKTETFLLLNIVMFGCLIVILSLTWQGNCDIRLLILGIWRNSLPSKYLMNLPIKNILPFRNCGIFYSAFSALLLFHAIMKHPHYNSTKPNDQIGIGGGTMTIKLVFWISLFLFITPVAVQAYKARKMKLAESEGIVKLLIEMKNTYSEISWEKGVDNA
jgi:hypothetical protein